MTTTETDTAPRTTPKPRATRNLTGFTPVFESDHPTDRSTQKVSGVEVAAGTILLYERFEKGMSGSRRLIGSCMVFVPDTGIQDVATALTEG